MTVKELIEALSKVPQDLMVRAEAEVTVADDTTNYWVQGLEVHETGSSGYELNGEVVLIIGE